MNSRAVTDPFAVCGEEDLSPSGASARAVGLNATVPYVISMTKDEMPPFTAFWSATLYDSEHGFFIPNKQKKYSVGQNAGLKLDASGGIEIHIAVEQPHGVPAENWLPITRTDLELDVIMHIYVPDLEKMKTWKAPEVEMLS